MDNEKQISEDTRRLAHESMMGAIAKIREMHGDDISLTDVIEAYAGAVHTIAVELLNPYKKITEGKD
jgi:hypothetical protein